MSGFAASLILSALAGAVLDVLHEWSPVLYYLVAVAAILITLGLLIKKRKEKRKCR